MVSADSFSSAANVAREVSARQRAQTSALRAKQRTLDEFAGIAGGDEAGRRLDRREFDETTAALHWLANSQAALHRGRGHYGRDVLAAVESSVNFRQLPVPHGVHMEVSDDGQSWWAWRRTVTGWHFAIGSAGPPPDEWRFDGAEPPQGFPGTDPIWGATPWPRMSATNW
jgi:hypothetical protein